MTERIEWDDAATARYYEAFCAAHSRYRDANAALVAHAEIARGQRILDLGAGTGRTAETVLPLLGDGRVDCVEPAAAMRAVGRARLRDSRVAWRRAIPDTVVYDRVLCGAAIWQMAPLQRTFETLRARLARGGALVFNVPGLYLGVPDPPGRGGDPLLTDIPAALAELGQQPTSKPPPSVPLPSPADLEAALRWTGFSPRRWSFEVALGQAAMRDWLKIPVLTNELLPGMDADARARRVDEAWTRADKLSEKRESWLGWTCWQV